MLNLSRKDITSEQSVIISIESIDTADRYIKSIAYPVDDTLDLASGNYSINLITSGNSIIEPSKYDAGDGKHVWVSLDSSGEGTYNGT